MRDGRIWTAVACAAVLALATPMASQAQDDQRSKQRARAGGAMTQEKFQQIDSDGDSRISLEEARAASARFEGEDGEASFKRMDLDGDGYISMKEATRTSTRKTGRQVSNKSNEMFTQIDGDGDGYVTLEEAQSAGYFQGDGAGDRFAKLDRDGDGMLNRQEATRKKAQKKMQKSREG